MDSDERRISERRPASENRASLQWAGGAGFLNTPARLVDISETGASFVAVLPPPKDTPVWLRVETPTPLGWVRPRCWLWTGTRN
jgi:hypothetical protein